MKQLIVLCVVNKDKHPSFQGGWESGVLHEISWVLSVVIIQYKENTLWAAQTHLCAAFGMWAASLSLWPAMELDRRLCPVALDLSLKGA